MTARGERGRYRRREGATNWHHQRTKINGVTLALCASIALRPGRKSFDRARGGSSGPSQLSTVHLRH